MAGTVYNYLKRSTRWIAKWGFPIALAAASGYWGYKTHYIDPDKQGSPTQKIEPSAESIYNGIWPGHCTDPSRVRCLESKFGEKVDISFRFFNFREMRSDKPFPAQEASYMRSRGGVLYLELEPDMGSGTPNLLEKILSGKFDKELDAFARGAAEYNGPVFLSFGHEMNVNTHAWGGKAELYVRAYRHVHDKIAGRAPNVTWVWNPYIAENLDPYYPGSDYVDWVGISFFHHSKESVTDLAERVGQCLAGLKQHGKPLMISRFASSAGEDGENGKAQFFSKIVARFKDWGIKAYNYFNFFELSDRGLLTDFTIQGEEIKSYRQALSPLDLDGNIFTVRGELPGKSESSMPTNCRELERTLINAGEVRLIEDQKTFIRNREANLSRSYGGVYYIGDPHEDNNLRLQIAKAYRELYRIFHRLKLEDQANENLNRAVHHLEQGINHPDATIQYHPTRSYVREYFELRLEMADLYSEIEDTDITKTLVREIEEELNNWQVLLAKNVSSESVPGYQNRARLVLAQTYENDREIELAWSLYLDIDAWATGEQAKGDISHWWAGENRHDLRFIATLAKLGLVRHDLFALQENAPETGELEIGHILEKVNAILAWEEAGCEATGCFMDRGIEAIIYSMQACLNSSDTVAGAKHKFQTALPWERINGYSDLKRALQLEDYDLSDPNVNRWDLMLRGLSNVNIGDERQIGILDVLKSAR